MNFRARTLSSRRTAAAAAAGLSRLAECGEILIKNFRLCALSFDESETEKNFSAKLVEIIMFKWL
jgi:hypothetical protein